MRRERKDLGKVCMIMWVSILMWIMVFEMLVLWYKDCDFDQIRMMITKLIEDSKLKVCVEKDLFNA